MFTVPSESTLVCEKPCTYEFRDGLVYCIDPSIGVVRAFRLHTFYATFANAAKCMQECHGLTTAEIIRFPGADTA